jgi:proteic killer suppression protein
MDIRFADRKLERECNDSRLLRRRHGERRAKLLRRRLDELHDAQVLEDLRNVTGARCHELTGNLKGFLSVDLDHPYRLLIRPDHDPVPRRPDGGVDWSNIQAVIVVGVEDTHE